ncbi:MAG: PAS domain S-box protein, partial [Deltaproteobacteria bacterium]|nr:PAS domain S-box protein [Deltaproteobacteria bacterium]
CIVVENGADALQVATSQDPPDLILLDIIMPEMDGYEVCKRLKAKKSTSDIPVIFITTKQDEDDEARGLGLGAVDYIRKPFSPSIVKARVRTHLELKKHRNRLEELVNERTVKLKKTTKKMQVEIAEREQAEEALRKVHDELEWRVKERTGELVRMNDQLKLEIEERKWAEEALQTREKLINALLNNQIDAATVVDKDLKMLYVNEFLADRFGRSVDEMIGLSPEDVVDKADLVTAKRVAYFKQVATTGKPVRFEDKRGGIWFDTVVTPVLDKDGQVFQVAILARDITDKKKIAQALVESEEKYRGLVETMAEGLAIQDEKGLIIYVNNRFCKMTGYQQHEVIGKKIIDFLDDRNKQIVKGEIAKRRKGAPAQSYETEIIRKDGHQISVFLSPKDILDSDGQFKGSFAVFTDISYRKQAEERLKASEQRLAQTINFLPDATMVIDLEGKVIAWNRAIENMTGIKAQDMLGKGDYEYAIPFYGERRPVLIDIVGKWDKEIKKKYQYIRMEEGSLVSETYDPLVKPGGFLWNKASLLYNHNGEVIGAIESIRDITDRKVAEAALRESEAKYRELAENAGLGIYQVTKGGKFLMANQRMANIFGYDSQQDFLGNVDSAIKLYVNPEERPSILKDIDEKGYIDGRELNLKRKDGTPIFCNAYIRSIRSKDGEYIYEGLLEDITARKRTAKELRLISSNLLKAQERERKRISLELHDELGQSLLALKLQISFIEKGLEEGQAELRSDCQAMLDQIVGLIGHVRRICKDLSPVILDDLGLTAGIRWLVENALKSHDIDTSLDIVNIDKLLTNEQQLLVFRIFQETFTNIVRHSCSSLTSIIIRKQGGEISFVIEDNGKGFDVKEAMGRDLAKRGMGLSSMEERAWMLGGSVNIWSQKELGTRIEFRVPIEQPEKT